MLKTMQCILGTAALALTLGVTAVSAQQDNSGTSSGATNSGATSSGGTTSGGTSGGGMSTSSSMSGGAGMMNGSDMMGGMAGHTDWSRRYVLSPMEHRRLRALGLSDDEVFAAANVAERTGIHLDAPNFDDPAQMLQRGATMWDIADKFNVPLPALHSRRPEWETAEWRQAVDSGSWYAHPTGMTGSTMTGTDQSTTTTTRRSRRTRTERDRTTTDTTTTPGTGTDTNQPGTGTGTNQNQPGTNNQNNQPGTGNGQ